jgi:HEPN domain-containing protein
MGAELLIASLLRYAQDDLEAARALALKGNRYAAFHYEQAAEKITKAVLTSESVHATRDHQHLLDRLVDLVPDANPVKALLREIEHLTSYATTFRYPLQPSGKSGKPPSKAELEADDARVQAALLECAKRLGVDLSGSDSPAARPGPIR